MADAATDTLTSNDPIAHNAGLGSREEDRVVGVVGGLAEVRVPVAVRVLGRLDEHAPRAHAGQRVVDHHPRRAGPQGGPVVGIAQHPGPKRRGQGNDQHERAEDKQDATVASHQKEDDQDRDPDHERRPREGQREGDQLDTDGGPQGQSLAAVSGPQGQGGSERQRQHEQCPEEVRRQAGGAGDAPGNPSQQRRHLPARLEADGPWERHKPRNKPE